MITENLSTLKIHKLTQEQYERELNAGRIDPSALYLTPDDQDEILAAIDRLNALVGNTSVEEQINEAIAALNNFEEVRF